MVKPTQVVTLQELKDIFPTLRLRLEAKSSSLAFQRQGLQNRGVVERCPYFLENMFANAVEGIGNFIQIEILFDKLEEKAQQQREAVKRELPTMTPDQQEKVLTFWKAVSEFIDDVFNWLETLYIYMKDKIRQGFKIEEDAVTGLFSWIMQCFKNVFWVSFPSVQHFN